MLIEKEVIGPGTVWYNDLKTGEPRKSVVTDAHLQHWCDRGNEMLALGLTVPVPCEHDFQAHPMTPAEQLKNNAGWVKEYKLKDSRLFSVIDVQDEGLAKKLPSTVRWTSPWFSSFTDGNGKKWDNVIAHLALTTRPRLTNQAPFPSIAAAIAAAPEVPLDSGADKGYTFSRAGLLKDNIPLNRIAFSLYSGIALSEEDVEEEVEKPKKKEEETPKNKLNDSPDDMKLDKLLCDLLCILGVPMPENVSGTEFKKTLYMAAMAKIKELSTKPAVPPHPQQTQGKPQQKNPIVQEQQPMYMSLEDINKIPDETMKNIALSMYNENVKLRGERDADSKLVASLRDAKLAEEKTKRNLRIGNLSRRSPRVKADLDAMLTLPSMALSMGDGGVVTDPMAQTLTILEKGLADMPALLSTELSMIQQAAHPTDGEMSQEAIDKTADDMARMMGCAPEKKAG